MPRGSNASASAFGWEFQSNAAIILMLDNIKEAEAVRVEGSTEDIEVYLSNGKVIYSQAKSAINSDDNSNAIAKLKASLRTLNGASRLSNVHKLVHITNLVDPFNDITSVPYFVGKTQLSFSDLPIVCKTIIHELIEQNQYSNIEEQNLEIHVLPFHGDGENRYKFIKTAVYEFLDLVGLPNNGLGPKILLIWQNLFFANASQQDLNIRITKKDLVWPVVVTICENDQDADFLNEYDDGEIDEIKSKYSLVINSSSECFEFTTKVIYDYSNFTCPMQKEKINSFINTNWNNYIDDFIIDGVDSITREAVIKLIIHKILMKRQRIATIRRTINI